MHYGSFPAFAGGGGGLNSARKLTAVLVVLIMLIVPFTAISMMSFDSSSESIQKVTYQSGDGTGDDVTISYAGKASTEYNPLYDDDFNDWAAPHFEVRYLVTGTIHAGGEGGNGDRSWTINLNFSGSDSKLNITPDLSTLKVLNKDGEQDYYVDSSGSNTLRVYREGHEWYDRYDSCTLTVSFEIVASVDLQFGGWKDVNGNVKNPGDVLTDDIDGLIAYWVPPYLYYNEGAPSVSGLFDNGWTWNLSLSDYRLYSELDEKYGYTVKSVEETGTRDVYSQIILLDRDVDHSSNSLRSGTYRSIDIDNPVTVNFSSTTTIQGDVILDNLVLTGNVSNLAEKENHGGSNRGALCADGHMLIIGTGVSAGTLDDARKALQVFGGSGTSSTINKDTNVIIHSGVYYNIVAGSLGGTINGSTHLVMRGGVVLDTVVGGNGIGNADVDGSNKITKDTNVYILRDAILLGDFYEESYLAKTKYPSPFYEKDEDAGEGVYKQVLPEISESTILTGGSNNGIVGGSTYVTISDGATLWDVQGGGRRGTSQVFGTANVTVSGDAVVKHLVCGSITDGLQKAEGNGSPGKDNRCVGSTRIIVKDDATVGSVFGGGYDTYYEAAHVSMMGDDSSITIEISGGKVGYVYGGGYRGTIGTSSEPLGSVTISITGGTVLNDVFGGGRGGLDKVLHNADGTIKSESMGDTTGYSKVYANSITISISGDAKVGGNVYGGGESTPVSKFVNTGGNSQSFGNDMGVASVIAESISVNVSGGAKVMGNVYGAGKGVDVNDLYETTEIFDLNKTTEIFDSKVDETEPIFESVYAHSTAFIMALTGESEEIIRIPWISNTSGTVEGTNDVYVNYASVITPKDASSSIKVNINTDAVVGMSDNGLGDVYAGGEIGKVDVTSVDLTIDGATVEGSVYGGGMGVAGSDFGSVTVDSSSITISNGAIVQGEVYGGGAYGLLDAGTVDMEITGLKTYVSGSVYGGGLGQEGKLATVVEVRNIVINGSSIGGNVYGGSRYGDDNYVQNDDDSQYQTNIYILSGNIATGSSGNVYGGGYKGRSKMDVLIQVGSAVPISVDEPLYEGFSIRSIYGGASVGEVDDSEAGSALLNQQLLFGNVDIEIGGFGKGANTISGDVFGAGDYCDISGTSKITFTDFEQEGSMLSIQKADSVKLVNSEIVLKGNVDGNTSSGSAKFSINDVGKLTLEGNSSGRSGLVMNAQVSSPSAYESISGQDIVGDNKYIIDWLNYIQMNGGKMFSVLGPDNDGTIAADDETVDRNPMDWIATSGVTLFLGDSNTYYGTFAISGPQVDDSTVFVLEDGSKAAKTTYEYIQGVVVTVWYRAGAFTVDETITLSSTNGESSGIADISIPKMSSGSEIRYVGHYVSMNSEGSLNIVDSLSGNPGMDFKVVLGAGAQDDGNIHFNGFNGINLANPGDKTSSSESGARVNIQVSTQGNFSVTGYAGTIHIHMVEVRGSIVIGTFDIEVAIYLNLTDADKSLDISQNILVKDIEGNKHSGTTDVYLPVTSGTADYTLVSVDGLDENASLEMSLVSTNLNKPGWLLNLGKTLSLGEVDLSDGKTEYLGLGGIFPPVLHFEFTCGGHEESDEREKWDPIKIVLSVVPEGSSTGYIYTIELTPKLADQRTVVYYDMWLETNDDGNVSWGYPKDSDGNREPLFELQVDFGDSMMGVYVLIDTSNLNIKWDSKGTLAYNMTRFMEVFAGALETVKDDDGNILVKTGTRTEMELIMDEKSEDGWKVLPVYSDSEDLLDLYRDAKRDFVKTQYGSDAESQFNKEFGYLNNVRWFDNPEGPAQFNFYSQVTEDNLQIFAGYGVIITFDAYADMTIAGQDLWVNPASMFYGDLETPVNFNELKESLQVTTGYYIKEFQSKGADNKWTTVSDSFLLLQDVTIRVVLEPEEYTIKVGVSVQEDNGTSSDYSGQIKIQYSSEGGEFKDLENEGKLHYGDSVRIVIEYGNEQKYRILSVTGTYGIVTMNEDSFTISQADDNSSSTAAFMMPNGNLKVEVVLSDGYTLTIGLADSRGNDNDWFGLTHSRNDIVATTAGGSLSVELQIGLAQTWEGQISASYEGHDVKITITGSDADKVSFENGTITIKDIGEDLELEIVLMIGWKIQFEGYFTVSDDQSNQITNNGTVHTGDTLTVTANTGYIFSDQPVITKGELRGWGDDPTVFRVYVTGDGDVTIEATAKLHSFTVKVMIEFLSSGRPEDVTVTVASGSETSLVTKGEGWTYTALVDAGAEFTVTASAEGYIFTEGSGISTDGTSVTIYGAEETIGNSELPAETGSLVIATYSGSINRTYTVSGSDALAKGTFIFGTSKVVVADGSVTLEGFPKFVGTMILESSEMGTLIIISYPATEGM